MISGKAADDPMAGYPSFGAYYRTRVEPLIRELLESSNHHDELGFTGTREIADLIMQLNSYANKEYWLGGWDGREWRNETWQLIRRMRLR